MRGWRDPAAASGPGSGNHACLVVDDGQSYDDFAARFLADGNARGEKTVAFGPQDGEVLPRLRGTASVVVDPYVAVLGRGPLDPDAMFAMFREDAAAAERDGFRRLRVAADMDWLLPAAPTAQDVVAFEVVLDRVVSELGASVLCAYRRDSFDHDTITGSLCVHPLHLGNDAEPPFTLVAAAAGRWSLGGAVDFAAVEHFATALRATAGDRWTIDVGGLEFIDVVGMRAIADAAQAAQLPLALRNARSALRRHWALAGFDAVAPAVRFTT